jgi:hypothetical protein
MAPRLTLMSVSGYTSDEIGGEVGGEGRGNWNDDGVRACGEEREHK